eukprot:302603-Pleurochrysis_carterae.AAC.6
MAQQGTLRSFRALQHAEQHAFGCIQICMLSACSLVGLQAVRTDHYPLAALMNIAVEAGRCNA